MTLPMTPFPELRTTRLCLREISMADAPDLFALRSSPEMMRFVPRPVHTRMEETEELLSKVLQGQQEGQSILWCICLPDAPKLLGTIGLWNWDQDNHRAEIGYILHSDCRGRGFMPEAVEAATEFGFRQMGLHSIEAIVNPENTASARVLLKCGYVQEAHFRENCFFNGKYLDSLVLCKVASGVAWGSR
ncbi:MAG: GNAT family N-acetyltransferase [Saprospiraceae bacterium]|nr:GNAT family N-acetyltransferase [Saprospiraceae bacterium]HRK81305.1 GNAT family N-acetyltransferase [Saprospiraceae bacterium]